MKRTVQNFFLLFGKKKTYCHIFFFLYFGLLMIPQWFTSLPILLVWLLIFPIVALTIVVIGFWGIIGILTSKMNKRQIASKYISFAQISGAGLLVFSFSMLIGKQTSFLYHHQKFDAVIWQASDSASYESDETYRLTTPRQRMIDDLVENILPGKSKYEIEVLLGKEKTLYDNDRYNLIYMLAPERREFLFVREEALLIWFDDLENFDRYEIQQ